MQRSLPVFGLAILAVGSGGLDDRSCDYPVVLDFAARESSS